MNDAFSPELELRQTSKDIGITQPESANILTTLAQANGYFYNGLLDIYLSNDKDKQTKVTQLIENLPPHMRHLYAEGIRRFQEQLVLNNTLMEPFRGQEVAHLLSKVMEGSAMPDEIKTEVLEQATPDKIRFVEPSPGVFLLQADHNFYYYLTRKGITSFDSSGIAMLGNADNEPSFMITRSPDLTSEDTSLVAEKTSVRHEFHHIIWHFLDKSGFLRKADEATPELSTAFEHFRSELSAYNIEGRSVNEIDPYAMVYTKGSLIQQQATRTKSLAYICTELAKIKGIDRSIFLYPVMTSSNFAELANKYVALTPLNKDIDIESANFLYSLWTPRGGTISESIFELLGRKNAHIDLETMKQVAIHRLSAINIDNLGSFQYFADNLGRFAESMRISDFSIEEITDITLRRAGTH